MSQAATFAAALLSAVACASAADAQLFNREAVHATGLADDHRSASDNVRETLRKYAACLLTIEPRAVERTLAAAPGEQSAKLMRRLATERCLYEGSLSFVPSLLRGALFAAAYRRDYGSDAPPPSPTRVDFAAGIPEGGQDREANIGLLLFADCVAQADPKDARTAVLAPVGSDEEARAYGGLLPHLNGCLFKGQEITFSKGVLSGILAEVLYRNAAQSQAGAE